MKLFYSIILFTSLGCSMGLAQPSPSVYDIESVESFGLIMPQNVQISSQRDEQAPLSDCSTLTRDLEPLRDSLKKCGDASGQNEEFCKFTKQLIRRAVLGIKSEITGARAKDAYQSWKAQVKPEQVSSSEHSGAAQQQHVLVDQIVLPISLGILSSDADVDISNSPLLKDLARLNDPELSSLKISKVEGNSLVLETTSRATTCELIAGRAQIAITTRISGEFQIPADQARMKSLWSLRDKLSNLETWRAGENYKYLIAGHRAATFTIDNNLDGNEELLLENLRILLDTGSDKFKLASDRNQYEMAKRLPQTVRTRITTVERRVKLQ